MGESWCFLLLFAHLSVSLFSKQIIHGDNRLYHAAVFSGTQSVRGDERWEDALFCSGLCHEIPNTRSNLQAFRRKNKWAKFAFFLHFSPTYECFFCFVSFLIRVYRTILPPSFVGWWIALAPLGRNAPPALLTKLFLPPLLSYRQAIYCLVLLGDSEAMHGCRPCSTSLPLCAAFLSPPSFHFYRTIPCRPSAEREASHAEFPPLVCLLSGHFMPVFAPFYKNLANLLYKNCFSRFFFVTL